MITQESDLKLENDALPETPRVAIQGYAGAFHEIAARLFFAPKQLEIVPSDTFEALVQMVQNKTVDTALMAIENTLAGSIMYNYDLLNDSTLKIVGEVYLRIKQNLMVLPGQTIEDLEEVHSHPMAIAQCQHFFKKYPHIRLVETVDTALSAKMIRDQQQKRIGAIASTLAAELYDLDIIAPSIETNKRNYTRFLVLRREATTCEPASANKVSLCFSVEHEVGSLHKVLALMAAYNINLTKIQSAPIVGRQWEYQFFVDFVVEGSVGWQQALEAIRPLTTRLKVMGAYAQGEHFEY
ncbi:MAG: prephenate dehydratase [Bacteroidetes bacterium]|nr:MAG: prephenate dehydratase [Bacteroidota bacterium]